MHAPAWTQDLEAARAGDRGALERVLAASRQDLRRYAEHHCVVNDVEDAVQESLFTASRRLVDLRQLECFASWLFRIVKRECNRLKRGLRGFMHEPITDDIADACVLEHRGLARDLAAAIAAPAEWPMKAIRFGSPPCPATLSCTHATASAPSSRNEGNSTCGTLR